MVFRVPTLTETKRRLLADADAEFPAPGGRLRRSNIEVQADTVARTATGLHAHIANAARQIVPHWSEADALDGHADFWGIFRKQSVAATGTVTATGVNGSDIPAGAKLGAAFGGEYTVDTLAVIADGVATVQVTAVEPGAPGNMDAGARLDFAVALAGIDGAATVVSLTGGADVESDAALFDRLQRRVQRPPLGGALADYVNWAKEVPGVTRAWAVQSADDPMFIWVWFMMDDVRADQDGVPTGEFTPPDIYTGDLQIVADYITQHDDPISGASIGRPVGAEPIVLPVTVVPIDVTVTGLSPRTAETEAAVRETLAVFIRARADAGSLFRHTWLGEAVSLALGESFHGGVTPDEDIEFAPGEIAKLGTVTFEDE